MPVNAQPDLMAAIALGHLDSHNEIFAHSPLDASEHTIRVIKIVPGPPSSAIRCTIKHVSLNEDYVCLSYRWGEANDPMSIVVDDKLFLVRRNLWDFLWHARKDGNLDWLWIDAISIDQENIDERNHQVQQMANTYWQAKRVLVWLGSGDEHTRRALGAVSILAFRGFWTSKPRGFEFSTKTARVVSKTFWSSVGELERNLYWTRVWIIQELIHAKQALLVLGDTSCPVVDYLWFGFWAFECKINSANANHSNLHARLDIESPRTQQMIRALKASGFVWASMVTSPTLSELICLFGSLDCSDKRDKVFGLVSMSSNGSDFPIDYNVKLPTLFSQTAKFCLNESQNFADLLQKLWQIFEMDTLTDPNAQSTLRLTSMVGGAKAIAGTLCHSIDRLDSPYDKSVENVRIWALQASPHSCPSRIRALDKRFRLFDARKKSLRRSATDCPRQLTPKKCHPSGTLCLWCASDMSQNPPRRNIEARFSRCSEYQDFYFNKRYYDSLSDLSGLRAVKISPNNRLPLPSGKMQASLHSVIILFFDFEWFIRYKCDARFRDRFHSRWIVSSEKNGLLYVHLPKPCPRRSCMFRNPYAKKRRQNFKARRQNGPEDEGN